MDPSRIESYLRSTCSVLDFDIGELWCARKLPDQRPQLKFIQLYTSPTYEDFHSLLVQPDHSNEPWNHDEEKHRFSPIICRGVCEGGQIVWANTRISEGLTGRVDLPLNTAVGVPICSIENDLYILVLFAVTVISMTPSAVEYLITVARAVAGGSNGFLSASFLSATISPANTEDFVGVFDIADLVRKYSNDVEFHLLPMGKLQKFFDSHEILLFCDLFMDFKMSRDGRFTVKQLESLRDTYRAGRDRSDSISSVSSRAWDMSVGNPHSSSESSRGTLEFRSTSLSSTVAEPEGTVSANLASSMDDISNHGVYSADLNSIEIEADAQGNNQLVSSTNHSFERSDLLDERFQAFSSDSSKSVLHIYAHMTYKLSQCRFHEFMIAILGMTVFEAAELWLLSERNAELALIAAVYSSSAMHKWICLSETMRLKVGADVPGRVVETGRSHWDAEYGKQTSAKNADPRAQPASKLGVNTAFGVPLPGMNGICGSIVFYSSKADFHPEPLLVQLIEKAVHLMATSSLEASTWQRIEGSESSLPVAAQQSSTLVRWLSAPESPLPPVSGGAATSPIAYRKPEDFEQRLQLCRSLMNKSNTSSMASLPQLTAPPPSIPTVPDLRSTGVPYSAPAPILNNPYYPSSSPPGMANAAYHPPNYLHSYLTDPEQPIPESEVSAVYALASFGKVEWHSFLEGSGNETARDGYHPMKLDSDRILSAYDSARSKKELPIPVNTAPLPKCKVDGCTAFVENNFAQYCANHRSARRCQKEGCNKCAQGATKFCIAHGGGRRCTFPGCFKGARDKFFCAAHGGGKRCTFQGCTKSAVGGSTLCTAHGGGKRCQYPDCNKSSQSNTLFCVRHGGGRSCMHPGCTKVARGKTDFCAAHGGGVRCRIANCNKLAVGTQQLCRSHMSSTGQSGGTGEGRLDLDDDDDDDDDSSLDGVLGLKKQRSSADSTELDFEDSSDKKRKLV